MDVADYPTGAYPTNTYVACRGCGQLTSIQVQYPLVQASTLSNAKFCPMCGKPFEYKSKVDANGTMFELVAASVFGRDPSKEDEQIVASIYPTWDAYTHPSFKQFLKSLIEAAK